MGIDYCSMRHAPNTKNAQDFLSVFGVWIKLMFLNLMLLGIVSNIFKYLCEDDEKQENIYLNSHCIGICCGLFSDTEIIPEER
jgi:hypothetical protein